MPPPCQRERLVFEHFRAPPGRDIRRCYVKDHESYQRKGEKRGDDSRGPRIEQPPCRINRLVEASAIRLSDHSCGEKLAGDVSQPRNAVRLRENEERGGDQAPRVAGVVGVEGSCHTVSQDKLFNHDQQEERYPPDQDREFGSPGHSWKTRFDYPEGLLCPKWWPTIE